MVVSFEGPIGAGKTTLASLLAAELGLRSVLEAHEQNPFLHEFYKGLNVQLETEITFLLIHYSQLRLAQQDPSPALLADFSIEKDLVFAEMNLPDRQCSVFRTVYDHVKAEVGLPELVIYLDVSPEVALQRIASRGRDYEVKADRDYFIKFSERLREHFLQEPQGRVLFVDANNLDMHSNDSQIQAIRNSIAAIIRDSRDALRVRR
jgi:deoxyguanosine kinase